MQRMDWGFEDETRRLQERLPGGGGGGAAPAAPAAPKPRMVSPRSLGEAARKAGQIMRVGTEGAINRGLGGVETMVNVATEPARQAYNAGAQFGAGLTGAPAPAPAPRIAMPRVRFGAAGAPAAAPAPAPANPSGPQNGRGGPRRPAAPASVAAPAAPSPGAASAVDLGTFTGDQGFRTQGLLEPAAGQPTPMLRAPAFNPNAAVAPAADSQRRAALLVRGDAAEYLNPASDQAEMMRRAENAAGSYFLKGRPGARNAIVAANLGQITAGNAASSQFQRDAGATIQAGAEGAVRQGLDAQAIEGQSRLQRDRIAGDVELERTRQDAPSTIVGEDRVVRLRRGGTAAPVVDEAGKPIRTPAAAQPGQLTPQDLLKAYTQEREAIASSLGSPEEKAAALQALDANPLFRPLVGGGQGEAPDLDTFLNAARAANPGVSDDELTAYYTQTYGAR